MYEPTQPDDEPFKYYNPYAELFPNPYPLEATVKANVYGQSHKLNATKIVLFFMVATIVLLIIVFSGMVS